MATHFSTFAWRIPWTEEPCRHRPWDHKESDMTECLVGTSLMVGGLLGSPMEGMASHDWRAAGRIFRVPSGILADLLLEKLLGLPWWLNGKKFACRRRRHGFDP